MNRPSVSRESAGPGPLVVARELLSGPSRDTLRRVIARSIAVGSGKGGVGKTITACNLAILLRPQGPARRARGSRSSLRRGLAPGPLRIGAGFRGAQGGAAEVPVGSTGPAGSWRRPGGPTALDGSVMPVFKGLEILFPYQKLTARGGAGRDGEDLHGPASRRSTPRYDRSALRHAGRPGRRRQPRVPPVHEAPGPRDEPRADRARVGRRIRQRGAAAVSRDVDPRVAQPLLARGEGRLPPQRRRGQLQPVRGSRIGPPHAARRARCCGISHSSRRTRRWTCSRESPARSPHVLKCMRDGIDYAHGRLLSQATRKLGLPPRIQSVVTTYVHRNPEIGKSEAYLARMAEHLTASIIPMAGSAPAGPAGPAVLRIARRRRSWSTSRSVKASGLRREMLRMEELLDEQIRRMVESRGPFASRLPAGAGQGDRPRAGQVPRHPEPGGAGKHPDAQPGRSPALLLLTAQAVPVADAGDCSEEPHPPAEEPEGAVGEGQVPPDPDARGAGPGVPPEVPEGGPHLPYPGDKTDRRRGARAGPVGAGHRGPTSPDSTGGRTSSSWPHFSTRRCTAG